MQKDKLARLRAVVVGLVLLPLADIAPMAKIHQMRLLPSHFPFSVQTARISCVVFALLCCCSIPFINRYTRLKDSERIRRMGSDPELIVLILSLCLLLYPVLIVLLLSFLGLPIIDVYIYSYSVFVIMTGWLCWKRKIFWPGIGTANVPDKPLSTIKNTKSFTIVLAVLSILALSFLSLKIVLIVNPPEGYYDPLSWNLPWVFIYGFLAVSCMITVIVRLFNSQNAFDLTALMSIVLIYWFPFGTATYLYWRFKIKPKELLQNNAD